MPKTQLLSCLTSELNIIGYYRTLFCYAGEQVPTTAQAAMQQASILAANLGIRYEALQTYSSSIPASPDITRNAATDLSDNEVSTVADAPALAKALPQWEEPDARQLEKFTFVPLGEMLTLGQSNAAMSSLGDNVKLDGQNFKTVFSKNPILDKCTVFLASLTELIIEDRVYVDFF